MQIAKISDIGRRHDRRSGSTVSIQLWRSVMKSGYEYRCIVGY